MPRQNWIDRIWGWGGHLRVLRLARQVAAHVPKTSVVAQPVVLFNASARITGLSQNAAFMLLTSWALRLSGAPVRHFVCSAGMAPCVLGTNRDNYHAAPPCQACLRQSRRLYTGSEVYWFGFENDPELQEALEGLSVEQLTDFEYGGVKGPLVVPGMTIPLGRLVTPSLRWALRCHTLPDDEPTRYLLRQYIRSAYNVAQEFSAFLDRVKPSAAVIFNGVMYPEAMARWVAQARGLRVITYEVGFQPHSAFFSEGDATAYPMRIPKDFDLNEAQNARLDAYLNKRMQGQFTMAGIRFWPEMRGLDQNFLSKAAKFRQVVAVFTNVVYDTSQMHANKVFPHMFAWLDAVLELVKSHPDTLFVIRAHPDEMRPGTAKQSRESVRDWMHTNGADQLFNVVFFDSQDYISSYELIGRAKFVMVYNSSIGLEASLMGKAVLCAGKARYTQYPIVFFPPTIEEFAEQAEDFLTIDQLEAPAEYRRNARRFLYYQLFLTSIDFSAYMSDIPRKGYVRLTNFDWTRLLPENSATMSAVVEGVTAGGIETRKRLRTNEEEQKDRPPFILDDDV